MQRRFIVRVGISVAAICAVSLGACLVWFNYNYQILRVYPVGELSSKITGQPCTVLWASYYRPCSIRVSLFLSRLGLEDHSIVLIESDPAHRELIDVSKTKCARRRVAHIGNANTILYFGDGSLWFLPTEYRNIAVNGIPHLDIVIGDNLLVCSDGGVATITNVVGRKLTATLIDAHHDEMARIPKSAAH